MSETRGKWPERIDPLSELPGVVAHHMKKYDFARQRVRGVVIDIACGVGYGTFFLAPLTSMIIGVENADEALSIARERYRRDNMWFVKGDAEHLPLAENCADVVTCFEGIEHFRDPEAHLREVARVLKSGGEYIVSTPKPHANREAQNNPFHLHEFNRENFESRLRAAFGQVSVLGQRRLQTKAHQRVQRLDVFGLRRSKLLRPLVKWVSRAALKTAPFDDASLDDFVIEPIEDSTTEYVAICKN